MHWFPRVGNVGGGSKNKNVSGGRTQQTELYLVTSAEGRLQLVGKSSRMEKSVEAHRGACLSGRWSHEGAGIATGGEDGAVKIWSRSGMLRSTLAQVRSVGPLLQMRFSCASTVSTLSSCTGVRSCVCCGVVTRFTAALVCF